MNLDKIKEVLKRFASSLPTSVPYAGNIYTHYLSQLSSKEQKELLVALKKISEERFIRLSEELENEKNGRFFS